jgi:alkanesulfonate monooxygenase SsuD/methylene tetrahydromethanopterin reductase-like flavin-dependent oxidoreductase (luciferase family)
VPSLFWATPERVPDMQRRIDDAAAAAGRDPAEIRRLYNVGGRISDEPTRELLKGSPEQWVETLTSFADELGFDTFIFWPDEEPLDQLERFAEEVVPALRP